jgi:DnaK suppressor protein
MSDKKVLKKKTKKAGKKKVIKTAVKKTAQKTKPKVLKKKTKKPGRKKVTKTVARKISRKTKPKLTRKIKPTVKISRLKKPISKKSEEERKKALRKLLITRREEIIKEAKSEISKYIKGETRQLVDTALDDGDWSIIDLSEDISLKQLSTHRENLLKIDEALRKLDEGTYGICEDCGGEISEERLQVIPFAIHCLDCKEKREQIEEMEKTGGLIG